MTSKRNGNEFDGLLEVTANVLDEATLFLWIATPQDIEYERQAMEARHKKQIAVHCVEIVRRLGSGRQCTRVSWKEI
jgi:hypothetical protein